jgi:cytochrome c oxidase subunit 1
LGTTVAMTFMGATYWMLPRLLARELRPLALARLQPWLWFLGMIFFSTSYHVAGLRGLPRRVWSGSLDGFAEGAAWAPLPRIAAVGGVILFLSSLCFVIVVLGTWFAGRRIDPPPFEFAEPLGGAPEPGIWDRLGLWTLVAIGLVLLAYAYPLAHLLSLQRFGSPGFQPF